MRQAGILLVAAAAVFAAQPASAAQLITGPEACIGGPADPEAFGLALGVAQTILPPEQAAGMMQQLMQAIVPQMKQAFGGEEIEDPGLRAILERRFASIPDILMPVLNKHLPSMTNAMACAYVREFSMAELREVAAFAKTPAGKHYLSRSTAMISDPSVAAANQAYFADMMPVNKKFQEEVRQEALDYLASKQKKAGKN